MAASGRKENRIDLWGLVLGFSAAKQEAIHPIRLSDSAFFFISSFSRPPDPAEFNHFLCCRLT
jgi:hypothetical protein